VYSEVKDWKDHLPPEEVIIVMPKEGVGSVKTGPKNLVNVVADLCKGCELCVFACPSQNLSMSPGLNAKGYHPAVFSYQGKKGPCTACGICYWICPDMAISEIRRVKQ
jgi:2-oxoglutarate ferredoxin oxidoreductase subunit delta